MRTTFYVSRHGIPDHLWPNADLVAAATPTTVHEDTWLARIVHKFDEKTLLYGLAQRDKSLVDTPNGSSPSGLQAVRKAVKIPSHDASARIHIHGQGMPGVPKTDAAHARAFEHLSHWSGVVQIHLARLAVDLSLTKGTRLTERVSMELVVQAFNIFNHVQLGDPGNLTLNCDPTVPGSNLQVPGSFGIISSTVNFNHNNDNDASPNTGPGLPLEIQFMLRFRF